MTAFMLFDEFERDFEPLEEWPARHAAAVAMYCLTGQKCAQHLTDGHIPKHVLNKTFGAWPKPMVATAIADLCGRNLWEETDGALRFVNWDLKQWTKDREEARRNRNIDKQRAYRERKKKEESGDVTGNETGNETGNVTSPSAAPSSSSSSSPSSSTSTSPQKRENPSSRSGRVGGDDPVFTHWLKVMGKASTTKLTSDRRSKLAARRRDGYSDEQLCRAIDGCKLSPFHMGENDRGQPYNDLCTILKDGKSVDMHIETRQRGGPKPVRPTTRNGRMMPSVGTTAEDFADCEDIETQLARIRGEAAQ